METRTILVPVGRVISPGIVTVKVRVEATTESWFHGEEVTTTTTREEVFEVNVQEPPVGSRTFFWLDDIFGDLDESNHPGFTVVRDDDEGIWGPGGKPAFMEDLRERNRQGIAALAAKHGWDLDANGNPLPPTRTFSIADLIADNKKLMAHVIVEMGIFKSVGDAKRNGWDKPLETGDFCLTKKKIRFKIVD